MGPSVGRHDQGDNLGKQCLRLQSSSRSFQNNKKNDTPNIIKKKKNLSLISSLNASSTLRQSKKRRMSRFLPRLQVGQRLHLLASKKEVELKFKIFGLVCLSYEPGQISAQARAAVALLGCSMVVVVFSTGHVAVVLYNGQAQLRSSPAITLEDN